MKNKLFLGVGRSIITPKVGAFLAGYRPDLVSTAVNDDLSATAFYFKQGDTDALLVSIAVCEISTELCNMIRGQIEEKFGIKKENVMLHAIHTHSGPNVMGMYGWGDIDEEYLDTVFIPNILSAIKEAIGSASAVQMAIATGESFVGVNRRERSPENEVKLGQNPWGPFDPKMTILSFKDESGALKANLIHYGAHGTASGPNTEITRDWPGVMIDALEAESGAVTAFINGTIGDTGPRLTNGKTTGGGDIGYAMRHGGVAANDAVRIYKNLGNYHTPELSVGSYEIEIPLAKRIPLEEAKEEYKKYEGLTVNFRGRLERYYRSVIDSYSSGYVELDHSTETQSIIRLGDVAIVGSAYELFSEIGLRINQYSNIPHVLTTSLVNGCEGYFATESELFLGGYEINIHKTRLIQPPIHNADWYFITNTLKNLDKSEK